MLVKCDFEVGFQEIVKSARKQGLLANELAAMLEKGQGAMLLLFHPYIIGKAGKLGFALLLQPVVDA